MPTVTPLFLRIRDSSATEGGTRLSCRMLGYNKRTLMRFSPLCCFGKEVVLGKNVDNIIAQKAKNINEEALRPETVISHATADTPPTSMHERRDKNYPRLRSPASESWVIFIPA